MPTKTRFYTIVLPEEPPVAPTRFELIDFSIWNERDCDEFKSKTLSVTAERWATQGYARTALAARAESDLTPDGGSVLVYSVWDELKGWGPWLDDVGGAPFDFAAFELQWQADNVLEIIGAKIDSFEARLHRQPAKVVITQEQNDIIAPTLTWGNLVVKLFNVPVVIGDIFQVLG